MHDCQPDMALLSGHPLSNCTYGRPPPHSVLQCPQLNACYLFTYMHNQGDM